MVTFLSLHVPLFFRCSGVWLYRFLGTLFFRGLGPGRLPHLQLLWVFLPARFCSKNYTLRLRRTSCQGRNGVGALAKIAATLLRLTCLLRDATRAASDYFAVDFSSKMSTVTGFAGIPFQCPLSDGMSCLVSCASKKYAELPAALRRNAVSVGLS